MSDTPEPRLVTCQCQNCDGHIEFDASGFADDETRQVECPHCNSETVIFVAKSLESANAGQEKPPLLQAQLSRREIWFGNENSLLKIKMISGGQYEIDAIRLFNARHLQHLAVQKMAAEKQMGGVSTGLGVVGSFSSVLIASSVIGVVESVLSSSSAKAGAKLYQQTTELEKKLRTEGQFFPVGMIDEVENPIPSLWNVPRQPRYESGFIHNGSDFIALRDTDGVIHQIRWSSVEEYDYQDNK